ncbi:F0F1 ATP synthase subunit A [Candidatus Babeliales bacterium]|nr:F0F1 ATP synthase subunit A [Candidatus Babeliales bacterium]
MNINLFKYKEIAPFKFLGLEGSFWHVHLDTLIYTWIAMGILFTLALVGKNLLKRNPTLVSLAYEKAIGFFIDLTKESFGKFMYHHFAFITSLFLFTLFCSSTSLIPFLDESTNDLNTTLALGLTSFVYVQFYKIKFKGLRHYLKEFIQPIFFLAPINVVGELAKIASMSFRLFGNILGGSIIFSMIMQFVGNKLKFHFIGLTIIIIILAVIAQKLPALGKNDRFVRLSKILYITLFALVGVQMFFGFFEGLIQSFVLTMLTATYLSMGITDPDAQQIQEPEESDYHAS